MRKILFRGKRLDDGEWVHGFLTVDDSETPNQFVIDYLMPHKSCYGQTEIDPETVGQFTGLLDKNGKKIFEGDICRNTRNGEIVLVKWHGTMAGYVWRKHGESHLSDFGELFRAYDKYEVIGNIHDNPELLEA